MEVEQGLREHVSEVVIQSLGVIFEKTNSEIKLDSTLRDFGADELALVETMMLLERKLDVCIDEGDFITSTPIETIISIIVKLKLMKSFRVQFEKESNEKGVLALFKQSNSYYIQWLENKLAKEMMEKDSLEERTRNFIRTNYLTREWDKFFANYKD